MDQRQDQEPVRAGGDAHPIIGDRVIAGADRVDADDLGAPGLDLADAHFDRVAVVIFSDTEKQEKLGVIPVGLAELPEGAAHGVDAGGGHVDRAEAAMGRIVRRAEVLCPERGEGLRLVAPGEEGQFLGVCVAQRAQDVIGHLQGLVPGNLLELARAARSGAFHGRAQAGRSIVLHDARAALGAEYAAVDRVIAVALDIGNFAIFHMHIDPAPAGAHVASGLADLIPGFWRQIISARRNRRGSLDCHALSFPLDLCLALDGPVFPFLLRANRAGVARPDRAIFPRCASAYKAGLADLRLPARRGRQIAATAACGWRRFNAIFPPNAGWQDRADLHIWVSNAQIYEVQALFGRPFWTIERTYTWILIWLDRCWKAALC